MTELNESAADLVYEYGEALIPLAAVKHFAKWVEADGRFQFSTEDNGGVEITAAEHAALFGQQTVAMVIVPDAAGRPILAAEPTPNLSTAQVEALRLQSYADPVTGCDRYFSEVARLQALGGATADIAAARAAGAARYEEIKARYPWP